MSRSPHENELAAEMQSVLEQHPDYEFFQRLGSPKNFLTRQFGTGEEVIAGAATHYTHSQSAFANRSMSCLIDLVRNFDSRQGSVVMEDLYKRISDNRLLISLKTPSSYQEEIISKIAYNKVFGSKQYEAVFGEELAEEIFRSKMSHSISEEKIEERVCDFVDLNYKVGKELLPSITMLNLSKKYERYYKITETQRFLKLFDLMSFIGEESTYVDYNIDLGALSRDGEKVTHFMGAYKYLFDPYKGSILEKSEETLKCEMFARQERVDKITNLAATKALEASDEMDTLQYSFVFAILRGYNLRNVIGACFAQEMSLRWLLAQKDLPQFNKMPGIYLDVEAALLDPRCSTNDSLTKLISKEVEGYCAANLSDHKGGVLLEEDPIFDVPHQQNRNDFIIYLMETRQYRREDLSALVSCEVVQNVFNIAARNGDVSFFKMLQEERKNDLNFQRQFEEVLTKIDREKVVAKAMQYGGDVMLLASNLTKPASTFVGGDASKMSPVSVQEVELI